jgi:hypothetical protein
MGRLISDISISLDGFVAGPNPSLEQPLGKGGDLLHEWATASASWRESHGLEGGEENADSEVIEEWIRATGDGVSLFDRLGIDAVGLEASRVIASPSVTHLRFQLPRGATP